MIFIFTAKLFAVDANGFKMFFNDGEITLLNPYCKKDNPSKKAKENTNFSQQDKGAVQLMSISTNCNTAFHFDLFSWETHSSTSIAVFDDYFPSLLNYRFLESVSPPPRLA
ncbi:hypothetical protein [Bizionia myxarmorum]|uniref:Uncharacterized protein n=1 Tax=Bizionia myxarmorum TaxID=291186 RepID=A0A5D0R1B3_9FLAO|nr:hypothetical protein [Bizionia myxarmorum]TYB74294.1 hypothetical protein ES674_14165 [Bizionia myxarmorum]